MRIVLDGDGAEIKKFDKAVRTCGKVEFSELSTIAWQKRPDK
ncbi:hypothetical protein [Methanosarcina sp.]|nr:hypothetical protein [Methanosarcina sp.]MDW5549777.1 hypothetical protein [Methanosarcina sp.]MDW5555675.1 hypothetical protein [Methanosarcina sp.]MDW5561136.1 hypothetical protein [Methanosarcina sp.]